MNVTVIPYKIAALVYVFNSAGELLLLHRRRPPNQDLYSPIGGKLEQQWGESPHACALREIEEEIGVALGLPDIRLMGIVSERAYTWNAGAVKSEAMGHSPAAHWLMFCYEVTRTLDFPGREMDEGRLEWIAPARMPELSIPRTDREVIWPLVRKYSRHLGRVEEKGEHGIFCVHIDCTDHDNFVVTHEHPPHGP